MRVFRDIQIISAASILGLKRGGVERLPESLLSNGLQSKIHSRNQVIEIPLLNQFYSNLRQSKEEILNYKKLEEFSVSLKRTVSDVITNGKFPLVLGGDCSILIGALAGLKSRRNIGLFFLDGHADFYLPYQSPTGEAADMELAIISKKVPLVFSNIEGDDPFLEEKNIIHIGQRDHEETEKFKALDIRTTVIKSFDFQYLKQKGIPNVISALADYSASLQLEGYWIHFDTDVISDDENPAVDYRLKGGILFRECGQLIQWMLSNRPIVGMTITIFNPNLDTSGEVSRGITNCIEYAFSNRY